MPCAVLRDWFLIKDESPYMLFTCPVQREKMGRIPAVTHVDGSARVQSLRRDDNPLLHELLTAFYKKTGVPILLNTSFNRRGEPIVESPSDAYDCFIGSGIDVLILGNFLIMKTTYEGI
ncbi:hypothetical protein HYV58_00080 [Candidatus Peregrinibacteria bacterium]|nr:hypothetical protein [Candidatus Peregrinibacteria bacterium]